VFSFIQKYEGLDFKEALAVLAAKAGVELPEYKPQEQSQKQRLLQANEAAAKFFEQQLANAPEPVKEYVSRRRITPEGAHDFRLGYAPAGSQLLAALRSQGFTVAELVSAGLIKASQNRQGDYYDTFRHRLVFPLRNVHGQVVAFTGRVLDDNDQPKYLNSGQSDVYTKSQLLFNADQAKEHIRKLGYAILVEGNMDCVAVWQAGMRNVVAVCGTALTDDQLKLLRRFTDKIMVALDADLAGDAASRRGVDLAWNHGFELKRVVLPSWAKDPDECIAKDAAAWTEAVKAAVPIVDYYFEVSRTSNDLATVEGKKAAAKALLPIIAKLADPVEQTHYLQQLGRLVNVDESQLRRVLPAGHPAQLAREQQPASTNTLAAPDRPYGVAVRLLALLWRHAPTVGPAFEGIDLEDIPGQDLRELYRLSISSYTANRRIDIGALLASLPSDGSLGAAADAAAFASEELRAEGSTDQVSPAMAFVEAQGHCRWLAGFRLQQQLQQLQHDMRTAEGAGDIERLRQLAGTFSQVSQRLASLQS
jgi:DNA primase